MVDPEIQDDDSSPLDVLAQEQSSKSADETVAAQPVTVESLQQQLDEANNRVLRAQAELENFRKRARRDMDEQRKYANLPLITGLLPAFDNLDRAVEAAEQNENATGLLEGVKMVAFQIQTILQQYDCRRIAASGGVFDPHFHQAIAQEPSADVPAGHITREVSCGYQLHDRVIRPSQVMVSTGAPAQPANQQ